MDKRIFLKLLVRATAGAAVVLACACGGALAKPEVDVTLSIDLKNRSDKPVQPTFFGANLLFWIDDDASLARPELKDSLAKAGIRLLRFPGGTVADNYLWKENRLSRNDRFPYEDGSPTTDWREFLAFARAINVEPIFVVNTETFVREGRIEEGAAYAAEWVRACMRGGYKGLRWEIGNETYWHEVMTAKEYAQVVRVYAKAMRAADPGIKLGVNGHWSIEMVGDKDRIRPDARTMVTAANRTYSESTGKAEYAALVKANQEPDIMVGDQKWWPTVISGCGDVVDFLVVHCYYGHTAQLRDLDLSLQSVRNLYRQTWPGRKIELAMTEYNTVDKYRKNAKQKPYLCGISGELVQMMRAGVETACFWPLNYEGSWNQVGMLDDRTLKGQTAAAVLELFSKTIGKTAVPVDGARNELIGVAAVDETSWTVYLADYGLKKVTQVRMELPVDWTKLSAVSFSENGADLGQTDLPVACQGPFVQFTMHPGTLVVLTGTAR